MSKIRTLLLATVGLVATATIPAWASDAYGDPFEGWGFVKDDWQLVCDNTLTCRAAGYGADDGSEPVSMLLILEPNKASVTAYVDFINLEDEFSEASNSEMAEPTLWLNNQNYGPINIEGGNGGLRLNAIQTKQVIGHAKMNSKIEIKSAQKVWQISDKGLSAVLLKADEIQGRVGTSLALVSKNNPNKQTPKAAMAQPVIQKAPVYSETHQQLDTKKLSYFQKNIESWIDVKAKPYSGSNDDMGNCELINPKSKYYINFDFQENAPQWDFIAVDSQHTLASHLCWRGAYNEGYGYWLIDNDKPANPQLITVGASDYSEGTIWAAHKSRGLGDCWGQKTWVWDGRHFVLAEQSTTGMCRGFAGGAWDLPTYVSQVIESHAQSNTLAR